MKTPGWAIWLWGKWGKKIQPSYDNIKSWDLPDWAKELSEGLWAGITDNELKKKLYELAITIVKKFDDDFAKKLIENVWNKIKEKLNIT